MKKLLLILLALTLCLSFFACGEKGDGEGGSSLQNSSSTQASNGGQSSSGGASSFDFGSIMTGGATDTVWGKQDAATKQEIIEAGIAEGVDVSFGADGSMTIVDPESGSTIKQNPDGSWTINDGGSQGQIGGSWPDNEFTRLIPKPEFKIISTGLEGNSFYASFQNVSIAQAKAYGQLLKAAGFTVNAEEYDEQSFYIYEAEDAEGNSVVITAMGATCALEVSKS